MKISYKADYALKAILDLCLHQKEGDVVTLSEISKRQDIPMPFLEQIMLLLKKAGYVGSKAGKGGGFFLARRPERITLGEIVRMVEGPVEPIACGAGNQPSGCAEEGRCAFREVWLRVTDAVSAIVDSVTFADMMRRTLEMQDALKAFTYHI
jgi:Rrf2 family transcriptional regulator, cysteine metabolism repressor